MKEQIRNLISQNKLGEAIKQMSALPQRAKDKDALITIESRLNDLNEKIRLGILSENQRNLELNKIRVNLLQVCDHLDAQPAEGASPIKANNNLQRMGVLLSLALALGAFVFFAFIKGDGKEEGMVCNDRKIAVLVADFQNTENDSETDGFANSLVTRMDNSLDDHIYDISPVGKQSRKMKRYNEFIRKTHFESTCDTSGLFVNGFLSLEQEVFNAYITITNLIMKVPGLSPEKSIGLDNPAGIEFSVSDDAKFLADLLVGIIRSYEGKPEEALNQFFELQKADENGILQKDKNFKATLAHFKGNCYAMRGDNSRAKKEYKIVRKYGNPELKEAAQKNSVTSDKVNQTMQEDPELKLVLDKNLSEHETWNKDLDDFLKDAEKALEKVGNGFVNAIKRLK